MRTWEDRMEEIKGRQSELDDRVHAHLLKVGELGVTDIQFLTGLDAIAVTASLARLEDAGRVTHLTDNGVRFWRAV